MNEHDDARANDDARFDDSATGTEDRLRDSMAAFAAAVEPRGDGWNQISARLDDPALIGNHRSPVMERSYVRPVSIAAAILVVLLVAASTVALTRADRGVDVVTQPAAPARGTRAIVAVKDTGAVVLLDPVDGQEVRRVAPPPKDPSVRVDAVAASASASNTVYLTESHSIEGACPQGAPGVSRFRQYDVVSLDLSNGVRSPIASFYNAEQLLRPPTVAMQPNGARLVMAGIPADTSPCVWEPRIVVGDRVRGQIQIVTQAGDGISGALGLSWTPDGRFLVSVDSYLVLGSVRGPRPDPVSAAFLPSLVTIDDQSPPSATKRYEFLQSPLEIGDVRWESTNAVAIDVRRTIGGRSLPYELVEGRVLPSGRLLVVGREFDAVGAAGGSETKWPSGPPNSSTTRQGRVRSVLDVNVPAWSSNFGGLQVSSSDEAEELLLSLRDPSRQNPGQLLMAKGGVVIRTLTGFTSAVWIRLPVGLSSPTPSSATPEAPPPATEPGTTSPPQYRDTGLITDKPTACPPEIAAQMARFEVPAFAADLPDSVRRQYLAIFDDKRRCDPDAVVVPTNGPARPTPPYRLRWSLYPEILAALSEPPVVDPRGLFSWGKPRSGGDCASVSPGLTLLENGTAQVWSMPCENAATTGSGTTSPPVSTDSGVISDKPSKCPPNARQLGALGADGSHPPDTYGLTGPARDLYVRLITSVGACSAPPLLPDWPEATDQFYANAARVLGGPPSRDSANRFVWGDMDAKSCSPMAFAIKADGSGIDYRLRPPGSNCSGP